MALRPRSMAAQLAVLLVLAVLSAQLPASLPFAFRNTPLGQAAYRMRLGDRMVFIDRILQIIPRGFSQSVVASFQDKDIEITLDGYSAVDGHPMSEDEGIYSRFLGRRFAAGEGPVRVFFGMREATDRSAASPPAALRVSLRRSDGSWLNGQTFFDPETPVWLRDMLVHLAFSVAAILAVVALGVRGIVGPVTALAEVAERVGRGEAVEALPERGPSELRVMTAAFNLMHKRLHAYVEDRARMLAAISHDLRTPIASLRLRAEMVEDEDLRSAMVRTLDEMREMADAVLSVSKREAAEPARCSVDLTALLAAIVEDHRSLGRPVTLGASAALRLDCRAQILRRSIDNLVDNAVRYGGCAELTLLDGGDAVVIRVDDEGPGIPAERIEDMFMPFARLETSRSSETGGVGLGLAITRTSIRMHGGDVTLAALPGGGLRAEIVLPRRVSEDAVPTPPVDAR